jgi:hypothetical protein
MAREKDDSAGVVTGRPALDQRRIEQALRAASGCS